MNLSRRDFLQGAIASLISVCIPKVKQDAFAENKNIIEVCQGNCDFCPEYGVSCFSPDMLSMVYELEPIKQESKIICNVCGKPTGESYDNSPKCQYCNLPVCWECYNENIEHDNHRCQDVAVFPGIARLIQTGFQDEQIGTECGPYDDCFAPGIHV